MTTTDPIDVHRTQAIADIRALADFLEEHPDAVLPITLSGSLHIHDPGEFAAAAAALGDEAVLDVSNGYAQVTLRFGARVRLAVQTLASELLGERQAPLDRTDEVRRALDDLVTREGVSADG